MMERYRLADLQYDIGIMIQDKDGEWCKYEDVKPLIEVLKFYADKESYKTYRDDKYDPTIIYRDILIDAGQKAREALKQIKD